MWKLYFIIFLALLFSFASCEDNDSLVGPTPPGAYSYTSYDSTGTAIVKGWFTMTNQDSVQIIGNWSFEKIGSPQDVGPQVGAGKLVGGVDQKRVWVELNPQFRDNNFQLHGSIKGNKYSGKWIWITLVGISNHGTFEAIKN